MAGGLEGRASVLACDLALVVAAQSCCSGCSRLAAFDLLAEVPFLPGLLIQHPSPLTHALPLSEQVAKAAVVSSCLSKAGDRVGSIPALVATLASVLTSPGQSSAPAPHHWGWTYLPLLLSGL